MSRLWLRLVLALAFALPAKAAPTMRSTAEVVRERVLRMTEFLDTLLPGVLEERNATLQATPKFADLRDHEYFRLPLDLRYGVARNWELLGGLVPFSPNPINSGSDHRWGLGEARLGVRHDLGPRLGFFSQTTAGFEARIPLGHPPVDLNDHYTHVRPSVSGSRQLLRWPATTFYATLSYDRSVELTHRDEPPRDVRRRNIIEFSPGLLYRPSELGWFAEYRGRHVTGEREAHLEHEGRLGMLWAVPLARSTRWRLPGKWQLELAGKVIHEEGVGTSPGFIARVNWRTTLREVLDHALPSTDTR